MIAAIALSNDLLVHTCNPRDFTGIEAVTEVTVPHPDHGGPVTRAETTPGSAGMGRGSWRPVAERDDTVGLNHQVVVFDAADLAADSFRAGLLDGTVDVDNGWHMVFVVGAPRLGVQLAPNHFRPSGLTGIRNKSASTFGSTTSRQTHAAVMSSGARLLQAAIETDEPNSFQVYADPAGHPFCLCWVKHS